MKNSQRGKNSKVQKYKGIKTFTYFIPAPPSRKSGYREKDFDKIMYGLLEKDYELIEMKTESTPNGIFIICLLGAKNLKAAKLNLDEHSNYNLTNTLHEDFELIPDEDE